MNILELSKKFTNIGDALDFHFENEHENNGNDVTWEDSARCEKCRRLFKESEELIEGMPLFFKIVNAIIHPILTIKAKRDFRVMHKAFNDYDNTLNGESEGKENA